MRQTIIPLVSGIILLLIAFTPIIAADLPPFPGLPNEVWGTVTKQDGSPAPDGTILTAVVDNETYYTTIIHGAFGYNESGSNNPPFFIEDPENDNNGKIIQFFIGLQNLSHPLVFENGASTHLDLIVPGSGGTQGGGGTSEGTGNSSSGVGPHADAGGPYSGTIYRPVQIDGSGSSDADGRIVSYRWDLGDNATSTNRTLNHTYHTIGRYTVTLNVTDNSGFSDVDSAVVSITNDSDGDGWSDQEEARYGTNPLDNTSFPLDSDGDHIPDIIDPDNDNDGITNVEERFLGTDPLNASDTTTLVYQNRMFIFLDTNKDGRPDIFYNRSANITTPLTPIDNEGDLSVDVNNDGVGEYVYNAKAGTIALSPARAVEPLNPLLTLALVGMIIGVVLISVIIVRRFGGTKK
jgi:hypothetical protein